MGSIKVLAYLPAPSDFSSFASPSTQNPVSLLVRPILSTIYIRYKRRVTTTFCSSFHPRHFAARPRHKGTRLPKRQRAKEVSRDEQKDPDPNIVATIIHIHPILELELELAA